jgi:quercetin dioxygenase-like cupin family protein
MAATVPPRYHQVRCLHPRSAWSAPRGRLMESMMPAIRHGDQPLRSGYRPIVTRATGAEALTLWDQVLPPGAQIPAHYHACEETLTFLSGVAEVALGDEVLVIADLSTVLVPARAVHSVRNTGPAAVHLLACFPVSDPRVFDPDGHER